MDLFGKIIVIFLSIFTGKSTINVRLDAKYEYIEICKGDTQSLLDENISSLLTN